MYQWHKAIGGDCTWDPEAGLHASVKVVLLQLRREFSEALLEHGCVLLRKGLLDLLWERLQDFQGVEAAGAKPCLTLFFLRLSTGLVESHLDDMSGYIVAMMWYTPARALPLW